MKIKVGISNRHVHLTEEDYNILFKDEPLISSRELTQYGEFASTAYVTIKTTKNIINNVRVLGPIRKYTQIEITKTDAYFLGLNPPIRNSGDLVDSEAITIIGPHGEVNKKEGCIIATRHIHLHRDDTEKYGLNHNQVVKVKVNTLKGGIMDNVVVKTGNYFYELHIDTDDANAHFLKTGDEVEIIK